MVDDSKVYLQRRVLEGVNPQYKDIQLGCSFCVNLSATFQFVSNATATTRIVRIPVSGCFIRSTGDGFFPS